MDIEFETVRTAFLEAGAFVVDVVESVPVESWSEPGLGEWSVRELAVHTTRGATTVAQYLATAPTSGQVSVESPQAYYLAVLGGDDVHGSVMRRTREQADDLEEDVVEYTRRVVDEAVAAVQAASADTLVATPAGLMCLAAYLPTRVVELVVHGIDMCEATRRSAPVPATAAAVTLGVLASLSVHRPDVIDPVVLVQALTGRQEIPSEVNLLG